MNEVWESVKGYEGEYEVSNFGRVKRLKGSIIVVDRKQKRTYDKTINEKIIGQFSDNHGYKVVNLNGRRTRVHRIVAVAFLDEVDGKPYVNHIDGNKANNNVNNLEWCAPKENTEHAIKTGLADTSHLKSYVERTKVHMLNDNGVILMTFNSIAEAYSHFGLKRGGAITEVCQGKRKHFRGYRWQYGV